MYFLVGDQNTNGLRTLIQIYPRPDGRKKSRYMQIRKLSSGQASYYWTPPKWARKQGFVLRSEALGKNFIEAIIRAELLNEFLDDWRRTKNVK